jgi:hypothetical protein
MHPEPLHIDESGAISSEDRMHSIDTNDYLNFSTNSSEPSRINESEVSPEGLIYPEPPRIDESGAISGEDLIYSIDRNDYLNFSPNNSEPSCINESKGNPGGLMHPEPSRIYESEGNPGWDLIYSIDTKRLFETPYN